MSEAEAGAGDRSNGGGPIFVVGTPRAGTTWVQTLLAAHPSLYSRPETKLFQHGLEPRSPMTFRERYPQRVRQRPASLDGEAVARALDRLEAEWPHDFPARIRDELVGKASEGGLSPAELMEAVMTEPLRGGEAPPGARWVEKTPRHVFFLRDIVRAFPEARIVLVHRDLVDVAVSRYRTFGVPLLVGLEDGDRSYRAFERFRAAHPEHAERCAVVRYAELREDLATTVERLFRFVGVEPARWSESDLRERSREAFAEIYGGSEMMDRQPRMKTAGRELPENDSLFRKRTYMLGRLAGPIPSPHVRERPVTPREWRSPDFARFAIAHAGDALRFHADRIVRDTVARLKRLG